MNSPFRSGLLGGFIAGAAFVGLLSLMLRSSQSPVAPAAAPPPGASLEPMLELRAENRKLAQRVEELEKAHSPSRPEPVKGEKSKAELPPPPEVRELLAKLVEGGLSGLRGPRFGETLEAVKRGGKASIDYLSKVLQASASATERFYAAALLEGAGDPGALPGLAAALQNDTDDLVRRMASHAIAVLGTPDASGPLRLAAAGDADWGVRVNSAYGLAKLQDEQGLRMLQDSYESPATPAEYRLAILGGLADVASPSTAPLFRKILSDTQDASYLLASIAALEKMKDSQAVPALEQLAASSPSEIVKQAAAKAIDAIRK